MPENEYRVADSPVKFDSDNNSDGFYAFADFRQTKTNLAGFFDFSPTSVLDSERLAAEVPTGRQVFSAKYCTCLGTSVLFLLDSLLNFYFLCCSH